MSKVIYNKTKSHGNKNTPASGAGMDVVKISIPNGEKFSHFNISEGSGHSGAATFTVVGNPKPNAIGNQEIRIMWTNGPFSKCQYKLKVYSKSNNTVAVKPVIIFGDNNWYNDALSCMKQKIPFSLKVQGTEAIKLFNIIDPINKSLIRRRIIFNEGVAIAITVSVCVTIVAVSSLAVLGAVLLYSINQGCDSKVSYDTKAGMISGLVGQVMTFNFSNCG